MKFPDSTEAEVSIYGLRIYSRPTRLKSIYQCLTYSC